MGDWVQVTKTSRIRARRPQYRHNPSYFPLELSDLDEKISHSKARLAHDPIAAPILNLLTTVPISRIVALGLGNFSASLKACSQLALLMILREVGQVSEVTTFDPAFTPEEKTRLETSGFVVSPDYELIPGTLFYMIHCHMDLYEAVLARAAVVDFPVYFVCNSLRSYEGKLSTPLNTLFREVTEQELSSHDPGFNDTFLVVVRRD